MGVSDSKRAFVNDVFESIIPRYKKNKDLKIEDVYSESKGKPISEKKKFLTINVVARVPEAEINGKKYKDISVLTPLVNYMFREK